MRPYHVLLVETEDSNREVLERYISHEFPYLELHSASTPDATLQLMGQKRYDIVICDAFLRSDARISFIGKMCAESQIVLIIISGDTTITKESFSPHVNKDCIHHLLYKPLDLPVVSETIRCALLRLQARQTDAD